MKALSSDYSGKKGFKKTTYFKLEEGTLLFRILPAFSSFTDRGDDWKVFHSAIYGYKNSEGKHRPFESTLKIKTNRETKEKTVEVPDAAIDRINDLKAKLEIAKKSGNQAAVAALNVLVGPKAIYNIDKNMHMNVMDQQGNFGVLKIRYKAFLALEAEIKRLKALGIDALSLDDGRYLAFTRTGTGPQTIFGVTVARDAKDNQIVSALTEEQKAALEDNIVDLFSIYPKITPDEVAQIVAESDLKTGKSPACDRIFDARWKAARNTKAQEAELDEPSPDEEMGSEDGGVAPPVQAVAAKAPVITPKTTAPAQSPAPAKPATTPTTAKPLTTPVTAKAPPTMDLESLSTDEFFAQLGVEA